MSHIQMGSSPLTRGALFLRRGRPETSGLIPAHAGSTSKPKMAYTLPTAHPRSRGEHASCAALHRVSVGSSPLTRGAQLQNGAALNNVGLIPAHAGSTHRQERTQAGRRAHPRSRGEHVVELPDVVEPVGSSPLTRGALLHSAHLFGTAGLIPAHAGSTAFVDFFKGIYGAHPRSRGEHAAANCSAEAPTGSSPLTRGARLRILHVNDTCGLIPAHAGSTRRG